MPPVSLKEAKMKFPFPKKADKPTVSRRQRARSLRRLGKTKCARKGGPRALGDRADGGAAAIARIEPGSRAVANIGSTFGGVTGGAKIRNRLYAVETSKSLISYFPS